MGPPHCELTVSEDQLFDCVQNDNVSEATTLLSQKDVRVDCLSQNGMTLLQHAAYKGNLTMCELLLAHGADVNSNHHDQGYNALMFAALSGSEPVTQLLLEYGANATHENSVGRTASQMAAFVGRPNIVSLINNFFSKSSLEYYIQPHGFETEPKLPPALLEPLYRFILINNLSPVKLTMYLKDNPELLDEGDKTTRTLVSMCEKVMKQRTTNEVLGVKFHYMSEVVERAFKQYKEGKLDEWIKSLVKGRSSDNFQAEQEVFIRNALKTFPYMENQLIQQIVRLVAPVKIGDSPTALNALESSLNGQRFFPSEDTVCSTCLEHGAKLRCSKCKMVNYCNQFCQKLHWSTHKRECKTLAEEFKRREAERKQKEEAEKKDLERIKKEEEAKATEGNQSKKEEQAEISEGNQSNLQDTLSEKMKQAASIEG